MITRTLPVTRPTEPDHPENPDRLRLGTVALVAGLICQVPLGVLHPHREYANDSVAAFHEYARSGDWVLVHMVNEGELLHPMHLHGFHFQVVGQDGFPLSSANRYMADTLVVAPGQRFDLLVHADSPGLWAFHCHILNHVEGPEGMFGMVTVLVVNK